jgi:protein-export membrane protein SecF
MATETNTNGNFHLNVMGRKGFWLWLSLAYMVPFTIAIIVCFQHFGAPVKLGLDFTGGTLMQATYSEPVKTEQVRTLLEKEGVHPHIQTSTDNKTVMIRSQYLDKTKSTQVKEVLGTLGTIDEKSFRLESVGPTIGAELLKNAAMAMGIGTLALLLYISFRYQFDFAVSSILAMLHDGVVMLGMFSILSLLVGAEADGMLVVSLLTIMGFSVHDKIVIFDRLRENMKLAKKGDTFDDVANLSINQTLARSINISLTLVLTLLPLVLMGGSTIFYATLVMLIGVISGTYSSIFNAVPVVVLIRNWSNKKPTPAAA